MSPKKPKNIAASVRQRLLNLSKSGRRPFQEILQYYAMERFLYRLSISPHGDEFILKGALMLRAWRAPEARPTMDIDVLGKTSNEQAAVVRQIQEILAVEVEPDGVVFDAATVQAERITHDADYAGIRIRFRGTLESARINMQVDVGFGDVVFPGPEAIVLPTLLDFPAPALQGYSRESTIAEKFEAMVSLGELNSRMKDFFDIWLLLQSYDFEGEDLAEAIRRTFDRRGTELPETITAFTPEFSVVKQVQWRAFVRRLGDERSAPDFTAVVSSIANSLSPLTQALHAGAPMPDRWPAPGPWVHRNAE